MRHIFNYHFYRVRIDRTNFEGNAAVVALNTWVHVVIVYHGLNDGEGFSSYFNGQLVRIDDSSSTSLSSSGNLPGKMTLGSQFPDALSASGNIMLVDEITMWDGKLNETHIRHLAAAHLNDEL